MSTAPSRKKPRKGEPAWAMAEFYPLQGYWAEAEYLRLNTNRLVEFDNGFIEVLPVPTDIHRAIMLYLYRVLFAFAESVGLGTVRTAGTKVLLWADKYRQPDIAFMLAKNDNRRGNEFWQGADLLMEVVSPDPDDRRRGLVEKRAEYAKARIPEYWTVDPKKKEITVLTLSGKKYTVAGCYRPKQKALSVLLKGFEVDVQAVFAAK